MLPGKIGIFARIFITNGEGESHPAFGEGVANLLRGVRDSGSLNRAAKQLGMAYSKAWKLMGNMEESLGFPLIIRDGAHGSTLSTQGEMLLSAYTVVQQKTNEYALQLLSEEMSRLKGEGTVSPDLE
jgi:molybdate transport system regulatory protein